MQALDGVDLEIRAGEIHALCGENGAGKSTLIKILGGVLAHGTYQGEVSRAGRPCRFKGPRDSLAAGIRIIFQELALAPDLSVAENVFLGRETVRGFRLERERMQAEAARRLALLGLDGLDPAAPVRTLAVGLRQMVEIARALEPAEIRTEDGGNAAKAGGGGGSDGAAAPILILDEPTSALSLREAENLLAVLSRLKARGLGILYVSHKLEEVFAAADRISVLRNGRSMGTMSRGEATPSKIVSLMVGRALEEVFPPLPPAPDPGAVPALSVRDWTVPSAANPAVDLLAGISFDLRPGEILGLAGLMGAGRTELVESLFGLGPARKSGSLSLGGEPYAPSGGPAHAVARGLALVPEDRRRNGLWLEKSIRENVAGACLARLTRLGVIDGDAEARLAADSIRELGVKAPHAEFAAGQLSGGNQQKVVLAKWLAAGPRVLFLDDPTRGVDVGAKAEIYRLIGTLAARGLAILLISSELDEVLRLSHRILVLKGGRIAGEFAGGAVDKETILATSAGAA